MIMARRRFDDCCGCMPFTPPAAISPFTAAPSGCVSTIPMGALPFSPQFAGRGFDSVDIPARFTPPPTSVEPPVIPAVDNQPTPPPQPEQQPLETVAPVVNQTPPPEPVSTAPAPVEQAPQTAPLSVTPSPQTSAPSASPFPTYTAESVQGYVNPAAPSMPEGSAGYMFQFINDPRNWLKGADLANYLNLTNQQVQLQQSNTDHGGKDDKGAGKNQPQIDAIQGQINTLLQPYYDKMGSAYQQYQQMQNQYNQGTLRFDQNTGKPYDPNVCTSFMSQIIPILTQIGLSAFLGPEMFSSMGLGTVGSSAASGALSSAITGGNPVVGALTAGLSAGANQFLSPTLQSVSQSVQNLTGSPFLGSSIANALGKGATSAAVAGLTGGNVGRAALTGAVSGGLTPLATNVASYLDPYGTQAAQNVIGSTLGTAAGYGLTGGSIGQGALAGLTSGLINNAKGLSKCGFFVSQPDPNIEPSVIPSGSGLDALYAQDTNQTDPNATPPINYDPFSQGQDDLKDVIVTASKIPPFNLDPATGLPTITPTIVANNPELPSEIVVSGNKQNLNVDPVTGALTASTSTPINVRDNPELPTEIAVTGTKTPTTPPEDLTPTLAGVNPNDLNFKQPDKITTTSPKVSVGTAPTSLSNLLAGTGGGGGSGLSGLGALGSIAPLIAIYGQTGDPSILEDIQQIVQANAPETNKSEDRQLEDLLMGKKNYDEANAAKGGLMHLAGGGSSGQFGNLFSNINMFCCTSPQWSPSMKNYTMTYGGGGHKNILAKMPTICGTPQGHAHGGLPKHYHDAAPKGHHPEFITGLTGYYADGRGTGQSDDIPAMLHDGDYVMDAETVSALGDGSSKAGREVLEGFMHKVPHSKAVGGSVVPAKIADGEFVFPAAFVSALGKGDNKAGAKILDGLREKLRAHKRAAPINKIPPKAKSPLDYISGKGK